MTSYEVTVWMNTDPQGMREGYAGSHPLATAPDLSLRLDAPSPEVAADLAFTVGNRQGSDAEGLNWPSDVRSVSVGDLLVIRWDAGCVIFAVQRFGFLEVPEPSNPRVELAGSDWVSSR